MFIHSLGRRIKNFLKLKAYLSPEESIQEIDHKDELPHLEKTEPHRVERWFYPNGKIKTVCYFHNDKLHGISTSYYENGNIKARENYFNGILEGLSKKYDEKGNLIAEEYYKNGRLVKK